MTKVMDCSELVNALKTVQKRTTPCILCGKPTHGSTGAAGICWPFICQPCKDKEDQALAQRLDYQAKAMDAIMGGLK